MSVRNVVTLGLALQALAICAVAYVIVIAIVFGSLSSYFEHGTGLNNLYVVLAVAPIVALSIWAHVVAAWSVRAKLRARRPDDIVRSLVADAVTAASGTTLVVLLSAWALDGRRSDLEAGLALAVASVLLAVNVAFLTCRVWERRLASADA